jgi:hypothetical protein
MHGHPNKKFHRDFLPPSSEYFKNPDDEGHKLLQNVG